MAAAVQVRTYLSGYKPIPNSLPDWDSARQATWPATTATLISDGRDGVLVDALMTITEGADLGRWIAHAGVDLRTIYLTHAHADHFFGAGVVLQRFPAARLVARSDIAAAALEQTSEDYLRVWGSFFPGQIADHPAVPDAMVGDELILGTQVVRTIDVGYSDVPVSSVVHLPELATVISGDVAYNGMHMWLAGSTAATRAGWLRALGSIEALQPRAIIAGHKDPNAVDDDAGRILDQSREYLVDFGVAAASCDSPADLIAAVLDRHPALGNPYTLWVAAHDQPELMSRAG